MCDHRHRLPLYFTARQTSCLPSMFSFFLWGRGRDGIPCPVSCCEQQQPVAWRRPSAARCSAGGLLYWVSLPPQPPPPSEERSILLSLSAVGWGLRVPKAVYINPEWSLCNCEGSVVTVVWSAAATAAAGQWAGLRGSLLTGGNMDTSRIVS